MYRGHQFPELIGHYLYGDYITGRIYAIPVEGGTSAPVLIADTRMHVIDLLEAPDGAIEVTTDNGETRRIQRSETREANAGFPRLLSQTGLFRSIRDHQMEPGVVAYEVNAPLWSDGASKLRYVAIPNRGTALGGGTFIFPDGTVFVKTFSLRLDESDQASEHHIETRLIHLENGVFHGYSYRWNEKQDDAILVGADGDAFDLTIKRATGGSRNQTWKIPSRAQCFVCHTAASNFILGFTVPQLNRTKDYDGTHDNQLRALAHVGIIKGFWARRYFEGRMVLAESILPKYADPSDVHQPLEKRARAYVNTNCGNCHRYLGGGNSAFALDYEATKESMSPAEVAPLHGTFGIDGARVLSPGDPDHSMIYRRMMMDAAGRMPKLGVSVVDAQGAELVREWIKSLRAPPKPGH